VTDPRANVGLSQRDTLTSNDEAPAKCCGGSLGQFRILHCQQFEWCLEAWQQHHSLGPFATLGPAVQVDGVNLRERNVAVAEQVGDGGLGSTEILALSEMRVQYRERCLGAPMMIVCYVGSTLIGNNLFRPS
jgi:hypothetical protein